MGGSFRTAVPADPAPAYYRWPSTAGRLPLAVYPGASEAPLLDPGRGRACGPRNLRARSEHDRPAGAIPAHPVDPEERRAAVGVVVVHEDIAVGVGDHGLVPGAVDRAVTGEDLGAAARGHRDAGAVDVRAGDRARAADHDA